jgi:hypothetical protein
MKTRSVFALFQLVHEDLSFCEARAQTRRMHTKSRHRAHPSRKKKDAGRTVVLARERVVTGDELLGG